VDESDHLTLVNAGPGDEEVVSPGQEEGVRTARGRGAPQGPGPTVTECLPPASVQVTITVTPL
jgi:hypothetical protein